MAFLETGEEDFCDARQPNTPDAPVLARFLARGQPGTDKVVHEPTRRRPRPADRGCDLTHRGFSAVGDVMHRDELGERQLAPAEVVPGGVEKVGREPRRLTLARHL
jgi:hypothetical protein